MFALGVLVYLVTLFAVSVLFARRSKGLEDFVLASRSVGLIPLIFTTWVANFGGGAIVGWTGGFYRYGLDWWWLPIGFLLALVAANIFVAEKIRLAEQFTLPDLMYVRYGSGLRLPSTVLVTVIGTLAMGMQVLAFAGVLNALADVPLRIGMILAALTFIALTVLGGLRGIVLTDLIQGGVIMLGLMLAAGFIYSQVGGLERLWAALPETHREWQEYTRSGRALGEGFAVFGGIATSQVLFQKIMAAKSVRVAKRMMIWLIPAFLTTYLILWMLGSSALTLLGSGLRPEVVIGQLVRLRLPPLLALIILATIVGVITTSANAILLSLGANCARDIYQPVARRFYWKERSVLVARASMVLIGLAALVISLWIADILRLMLVCFWIAGVAFLVPLYGGYIWRRGTPQAAAASMFAGTLGVLVSAVWGEQNSLHPTVVGFLASLVVYLFVTQLTLPKSADAQTG